MMGRKSIKAKTSLSRSIPGAISIDIGPCVTGSRATGRIINKLNDNAAMDVPGNICVFRVHKLGHDNSALTYSFSFHVFSPFK